ncbi:MAG TPA: hypothetical protein VGM44_17245 [Polyangiaceae bacterium]|jgi:hypothetical protein
MNRRQTLGTLGAIAVLLAAPRASRATTARAVSLVDLVRRSTRVAQVMPLEASSRFENVGDMRHIVTYTRLRIDDAIYGDSGESEILVRTLGGHVDKLGEIVHGEAQLIPNEACVLFSQTNADGIELVTEMAQGHYPLVSDQYGALRLHASRNMPHLVGNPAGAAAQLSGLEFARARALIREARR